MEIVGFDDPERIKAKKIDISAKNFIFRITLKPRKSLYSNGINYDKLRVVANHADKFQELFILYPDRTKADLRVVIDDYKL